MNRGDVSTAPSKMVVKRFHRGNSYDMDHTCSRFICTLDTCITRLDKSSDKTHGGHEDTEELILQEYESLYLRRE
jgi:hypothetical protein